MKCVRLFSIKVSFENRVSVQLIPNMPSNVVVTEALNRKYSREQS